MRSRGPRGALGHLQQRPQICLRVGLERGRLRDQLTHGRRQRTAAVRQVPLRPHDLVVRLVLPQAGRLPVSPGGRQAVFGVQDLVADLLVLRAAGPLIDAELLRAGDVQRLVLRQELSGFGVVAGEMADPVKPLVQILLDRGQLPAAADQVFGRAREVGDRALDRVHLVGAGGQAPVRGGVPEPPGPGVQLGGGPVQGFLRPGEPGARPGPLPLRAGDLAERLGHRRGPGQLLLRAAQIGQQVQHPLPLGGQVLPLTAQVRDQPVEFGEPGAAPAGPGGRPDVLRRGLGPGAQLQSVAVLRPGCHHGGTARTGPGRLRAPAAPSPPFTSSATKTDRSTPSTTAGGTRS